MKTIALFNNKGGVGKTSLVYHLAWMYADLGLRVIVADLDPQANLTSMFLSEDRLEELWTLDEQNFTIYDAIFPLLDGISDITAPHIESISANLGLIVGDLELSLFEDELSSQWSQCLEGKPRAFRVISAFYRVIFQAAQAHEAEIILIDVGPNLGAINRAAILAAEYVVIPLAPDLFSLQGMRNLGPALRTWRSGWQARLPKAPAHVTPLPSGAMNPAGYVVMQHAMRLDRPVKAYARWMERIPAGYGDSVLNEQGVDQSLIAPTPGTDQHCLATLKNYRSLMPLAMDAHKPMFFLKPADGAIGSHLAAATACYFDFKTLAINIAQQCDLVLPTIA